MHFRRQVLHCVIESDGRVKGRRDARRSTAADRATLARSQIFFMRLTLHRDKLPYSPESEYEYV